MWPKENTFQHFWSFCCSLATPCGTLNNFNSGPTRIYSQLLCLVLWYPKCIVLVPGYNRICQSFTVMKKNYQWAHFQPTSKIQLMRAKWVKISILSVCLSVMKDLWCSVEGCEGDEGTLDMISIIKSTIILEIEWCLVRCALVWWIRANTSRQTDYTRMLGSLCHLNTS